MTTYNRGYFWVYTFKEGILSSIAHDLRLSLERFEVKQEGNQVQGTFWPESLKVDGAMRNEQLQEKALNFLERKQIQRTIRKEVLQTKRFPTARFLGIISPEGLKGELTMMGQQRSVKIAVEERGHTVCGSVQLEPSRWGIAPYSAFLGTLKLQDRIRIEFRLEAHR